MRRHDKNSRSGLTSIVTSVIMLTAVTIMGTGVVAWGHSNIFHNEETLATSYSNNVNKIGENLIIEKIWFGTTPQKFVNITLNNQGNAGLNVTQIQFSTSTKTIQYQFHNQTISSQRTGSIQISPFAYSDNVLTNVQITTGRGTTISTQTLPP